MTVEWEYTMPVIISGIVTQLYRLDGTCDAHRRTGRRFNPRLQNGDIILL